MSLTERVRKTAGRPKHENHGNDLGSAGVEDAEFVEMEARAAAEIQADAVVLAQREADLAPYEDGLPFDLQRITQRIHGAGVTVLEEMVNIGKYLIWAKEELERGEFLAWLESEIGISSQRASEFMRIAQRMIESKVPLGRDFLRLASGGSKKKMLALLDVSNEEIQEAMQMDTFLGKPLDEVGAMSVRELRETLRREKARRESVEKDKALLDYRIKEMKAAQQREKNPAGADDPPTILERRFLRAVEALGVLERVAAEYAEEFEDAGLLVPGTRNMVDAFCATISQKCTAIRTILTPDEIMDQRLHIQPRPDDDAEIPLLSEILRRQEEEPDTDQE